jgi:hypothetical protein
MNKEHESMKIKKNKFFRQTKIIIESSECDYAQTLLIVEDDVITFICHGHLSSDNLCSRNTPSDYTVPATYRNNASPLLRS